MASTLYLMILKYNAAERHFRQRQIVRLHNKGYSFRRIAEYLGCSQSTVCKYYYEAVKNPEPNHVRKRVKGKRKYNNKTQNILAEVKHESCRKSTTNYTVYQVFSK